MAVRPTRMLCVATSTHFTRLTDADTTNYGHKEQDFSCCGTVKHFPHSSTSDLERWAGHLVPACKAALGGRDLLQGRVHLAVLLALLSTVPSADTQVLRNGQVHEIGHMETGVRAAGVTHLV